MDRKIEKKKWPLKKLLWIGGGSLLTVVVFVSLVWGSSSSSLNVSRDRLQLAEVEQRPFQEFITVDGQVEPIKTVHLDAVAGGVIEQRLVDNGALVEEGQPLMVLSNAQLLMEVFQREEQVFLNEQALVNSRQANEKTLLQLREQLLEVRHQLADAERKYEQDSMLMEKQFVSKNEWEKAKEQYEYLQGRKRLLEQKIALEERHGREQQRQLEQSLVVKNQNLSLAQQNHDRLTIKAPLAGQVTNLQGEVGEMKNPGEKMGQIDVLDGFKVEAQIDQHYLPRVAEGQQATFSYGGQEGVVTVTRINPEVAGGKFMAEMAFTAEPPTGLKKGQNLNLRLKLGENAQALVVPKGGFYQSTGGRWMYVMNANEKLVKREVRLGRQNPDYLEVLSGLEPGEKVVVSSYETFGEAEELVIKD